VSSSKPDISETQALLQMENHKQQIELILRRFRKSNIFVRIAESDEPFGPRIASGVVAEQTCSSKSSISDSPQWSLVVSPISATVLDIFIIHLT
jgi:hypothetical protein